MAEEKKNGMEKQNREQQQSEKPGGGNMAAEMKKIWITALGAAAVAVLGVLISLSSGPSTSDVEAVGKRVDEISARLEAAESALETNALELSRIEEELLARLEKSEEELAARLEKTEEKLEGNAQEIRSIGGRLQRDLEEVKVGIEANSGAFRTFEEELSDRLVELETSLKASVGGIKGQQEDLIGKIHVLESDVRANAEAISLIEGKVAEAPEKDEPAAGTETGDISRSLEELTERLGRLEAFIDASM